MGPVKQAVSKGKRHISKESLKTTGGAKNKDIIGQKNGKRKFQNNVRGMALIHRFGQNLLKNQGISMKIVQGCEIVGSDRVLEIGPGTGNLTVLMLPLCRSLTAVDIDQRMIAEVKKRCAMKGYNNLTAVISDAMKFDLPEFEILAANMPYQISSPFLFKLVNQLEKHRFKRAVLMFQKEFSERLMASPGDKNYSRLSVNIKMFFKVTKVCDVGRKNFNPPPKVDSMVIKLEPRRDVPKINYREWDSLLRILFSRKNRTLRSSLCQKTIADRLITMNPYIFGEINLASMSNEERFEKLAEYRSLIEDIITETRHSINELRGELTESKKNDGLPSFEDVRSRNCSRTDLLALYTSFSVRGFKFCKDNEKSHEMPSLFALEESDDGVQSDVEM